MVQTKLCWPYTFGRIYDGEESLQRDDYTRRYASTTQIMISTNLLYSPSVIFALSFLTLWLSAWAGARLRAKIRSLEANERDDFGLILGATLTLLGLIIGFSFSMAITRYDQRKNYEEEEANAIGTEYVRADLLTAGNAPKIRSLLEKYLEQRILFYRTHDEAHLQQINSVTGQLQNDLWLAVQVPALAQPTPVAALAVSGMNDVLNSQGYTQAAWRNRIPMEAWSLMGAIAICSNLLLGYCVRREMKGILFLVLPSLLSVSFFLIADIDSPRSGVIRITPQNLLTLSQSLHP